MRPSISSTVLFGIVALAPFAAAQSTCLPTDLKCIMTEAHYTVLGTVVSTNIGEIVDGVTVDPSKYNATMTIDCVYSSAGKSKGTGAGLVGSNVLVAGFGDPNPLCPNNKGALATPGAPMMHFLHVASIVPNGELPVFSVFNPCGGAAEASAANFQLLSDVLAGVPTNAIQPPNRGTKPECTLPTPTAKPTATTTPTTTTGNKADDLGSGATDVVANKWMVGGTVISGLMAAAGALIA
ncbi:hypothetical protein BC832DRAFT_231729 [Gaertneriomyces semiglobifer]|nr:hypothetical protein BC832DRAFT_231729 [Gaertneriomyces semiglobifer]